MYLRPTIKVLATQKIRRDLGGNGEFLASRDNGARLHMGVDFFANPGVQIIAPFSCNIIRSGYTDNTLKLNLILVQGISGWEDYQIKILYAKPISPFQGISFKPGETIGYVQDLSIKYSEKIKNHIHVVVLEKGRVINPLDLLNDWIQ